MEWWQVVLILTLCGQVVLFLVAYLIVSGMAQVINSQKTLVESMQTISDQMTDVEERVAEMQADVRKLTQHFVNFAKSMKSGQGQDKQWYTNL